MIIRIDKKEIMEINNTDSIFVDTECDGICEMYLEEGYIVEVFTEGEWIELPSNN